MHFDDAWFFSIDPEKDTTEESEANVDATTCEKTNSESNNMLQNEPKIKCQMNFESEIPPPSYKEATVQRWKNLRHCDYKNGFILV